MYNLTDYQKEILKDIEGAKNVKIMALDTGFGKTKILSKQEINNIKKKEKLSKNMINF